jgi:mitotic spindle assembly checkpoint protein MAD1
VEDRLTEGAGLVKQTSLQEAQDKISQLEAGQSSYLQQSSSSYTGVIDIQCLESTISQLTSANTTLDAEVNDLMRRVASGEYNPVTQRCIELRNNPAAKIQSIRAGQLDDLKKENEALLERLKAGDASGKQSDVPMESFLRLTKEKEESDAAHAKRLQRLKEVCSFLYGQRTPVLLTTHQIFSAKSREFLEAVNSLLGWRIRFDDGGGDIRMTSMYAPKGKMGLTLRFASEAGHYGTMQVTGGMARSFEESKHFWVTERQSVPGFLAQITTEMFERTTVSYVPVATPP